MQHLKNPFCDHARILSTLFLLTTFVGISPAFAEGSLSDSNGSCGSEVISVDADMSHRTIANLKMEIRSIISMRYRKKCSPGYVYRISPEILREWWDQANPSKGGAYKEVLHDIDPEVDPTIVPFAIFVEGLEYPILDIHRDNKIPISLDFNSFGLSEDFDDVEPRCPKFCVNTSGEAPGKPESSCICTHKKQCGSCGDICGLCFSDQPMSQSLCYTVKEPDKTALLREIPIGVSFPL